MTPRAAVRLVHRLRRKSEWDPERTIHLRTSYDTGFRLVLEPADAVLVGRTDELLALGEPSGGHGHGPRRRRQDRTGAAARLHGAWVPLGTAARPR